jgi:hypothetical protein
MLAVFTFPEALAAAQAAGSKIARKGWNGAGQFVQRTYGDKHCRVCIQEQPHKVYEDMEAFMVLRNAEGKLVPWAPSQGDMMATDWMVLP